MKKIIKQNLGTIAAFIYLFLMLAMQWLYIDFYKKFHTIVDGTLILMCALVVYQFIFWIKNKLYFSVVINFPFFLSFLSLVILKPGNGEREFALDLLIITILLGIFFLQLVIWIFFLVIRVYEKYRK